MSVRSETHRGYPSLSNYTNQFIIDKGVRVLFTDTWKCPIPPVTENKRMNRLRSCKIKYKPEEIGQHFKTSHIPLDGPLDSLKRACQQWDQTHKYKPMT